MCVYVHVCTCLRVQVTSLLLAATLTHIKIQAVLCESDPEGGANYTDPKPSFSLQSLHVTSVITQGVVKHWNTLSQRLQLRGFNKENIGGNHSLQNCRIIACGKLDLYLKRFVHIPLIICGIETHTVHYSIMNKLSIYKSIPSSFSLCQAPLPLVHQPLCLAEDIMTSCSVCLFNRSAFSWTH